MLKKDAPRRSEEFLGTRTVTRRTVARGIAWTTPVVAVATAAPAFAVSPPDLVVTQSGNACKHPGNPKYYHFTFCFSSTFNTTVTLLRMEVESGGSIETSTSVFPATVVVPAGGTVCKYVDAGLFSNSANGKAELFYSYVVQGSPTVQTGSFVTQVNDLPPCGTGADPGNNPPNNPPHSPDAP